MNLKELSDVLNMDMTVIMERFADNEAVFIKFLKKFSDDKTYSILCEAIENKDYDSIEKSAHTLKGIAANLGLKTLQNSSNNIVSAVRNKEFDRVFGLFDNLQNDYNSIIDKLFELE